MTVWSNKNFLLLFFARFVALIGDGMMFIVLLKKLEMLGAGSLGISFFYLSAGIPAFLFAIPAGAFVERSRLQKTMITTDLLRASLVLCFIYINVFIIESPFMIYTLLFLITINDMFFLPASQSLLRWVVPEKRRPEANGHLQIAMMTGKLLSYSLAALLIKMGFSLNALLMLVMLSFIFSIIFIFRIRPFVTNNNDQSVSTLKMAAEGLSFIKNTKIIKNLFIVFGLAWIVGSSIDIFLIAYLNEVLGKGTEDLYLITTFSLAGIIIGSFVAPKLYQSIDKKIGFYLPSLIFGLVVLGYALTLPLWMLLLLLMMGGVVQGIFLTFLNSYLQEVTSQTYYARVSSFYTLLMKGASLPGYFLIGLFIEKTNVITVGYIIGMYMVFVTIVTMIILPSMKENDGQRVRNVNY
ncbi:MFS transporter [Virgibacillus sp. 179-BFC.A HS]|uniref:MFS transporter n=1 Tax=Tigheibacillus jepli TaxID=3035914 RepID=A0ABU5CDA9_9BACI|nr:MFS transporter [Virgibacillus sp. 179-BFC.A HS]MDY0404251.1 MFS transporter [Virgibacillus sp. 179-BFC.A HS]